MRRPQCLGRVEIEAGPLAKIVSVVIRHVVIAWACIGGYHHQTEFGGDAIGPGFGGEIILGAGQVGSALAEHLADEQNDITVVDQQIATLKQLQESLDIRTVRGNAAHPTTLLNAGAQDSDMLIAVTGSDEINMLACSVAFSLFKTPMKISRIRSADYLSEHAALFDSGAIPVDVIISPEQLVTRNLEQLIANPGALQVLDFAEGRVRLVAVRAVEGNPIVGHQLQEIRDHMPRVDTRVAAIFRQASDPIIPQGSTVVEPEDEVFFIAAREHIREVTSELRRVDSQDVPALTTHQHVLLLKDTPGRARSSIGRLYNHL